MDSIIAIVERWSECDESVTDCEVAQAMTMIPIMGDDLLKLQEGPAYSLIEFYAENADDKTDARPVLLLLRQRWQLNTCGCIPCRRLSRKSFGKSLSSGK